MPSIDLSKGEFTIKEVLNFTAQSEFNTRFDYAKRDRVKLIQVKKVKFYSRESPKTPSIRYEVISRSAPQYKPFAPSKDKRGRYRKSQNSIFHHYDIVFVFGQEGISLNTKQWASSVGSMRKIPDKVPQDKVAQIHADTRERLKKKYGSGTEQYKKEIAKIKKRAKYLSDGDYIAQELGLNLDFCMRFAMVYKKYGHLYGRFYGPNILPKAKNTNKNHIVAFTKHQIVVLKELMKQGILTN